jgi:hypothetical protein
MRGADLIVMFMPNLASMHTLLLSISLRQALAALLGPQIIQPWLTHCEAAESDINMVSPD